MSTFDELYNSTIEMLQRIANRFSVSGHYSLDREDLVQEGAILIFEIWKSRPDLETEELQLIIRSAFRRTCIDLNERAWSWKRGGKDNTYSFHNLGFESELFT